MPERSDLVRSVKSGGDIFSLGTLLVDETGWPIRDGRLFCRDFRVRDEVAPFEGVELLDIIEKHNPGVSALLANDSSQR